MKLSQGAFNKIEKIRKSYRKRTPDSEREIYELFNTKDIPCNKINKICNEQKQYILDQITNSTNP